MFLQVRTLLFSLLLCGTLSAQNTYKDLVKDTIICRSTFLNRTYLLDGNQLTLPVMAFFMQDFPPARHEIQVALLTDQLSIAGYSLGSLFAIGGLLVSRQDRKLAGGLLQLGAVGIGSGIIFQIISGKFQHRAVQNYNTEIKSLYQKQSMRLQLGPGGGSATVRLRF